MTWLAQWWPNVAFSMSNATSGPACGGASGPIRLAGARQVEACPFHWVRRVFATTRGCRPVVEASEPAGWATGVPRVEIVPRATLSEMPATSLSPASRAGWSHPCRRGGRCRGASAAWAQRLPGVHPAPRLQDPPWRSIRARTRSVPGLPLLARTVLPPFSAVWSHPRASHLLGCYPPPFPAPAFRALPANPRRPPPTRHHADFREDLDGQDHHP